MDGHPLLLDEPPLLIRPTLACALVFAGITPGDRQAMWVQQVNYWIQYHRRTGNAAKHFRDGHWWVWNSLDSWAEQFPFWSMKTLRRTIERSVSGGLTLKGNYNARRYDRTLWYSIDYARLEEIAAAWENEKRRSPFGQNDHMDMDNLPLWSWSDCPDGVGQNDHMDVVILGRPIPETTTETTHIDYSEETSPAEGTAADAGALAILTALDRIGIGEPTRGELAQACGLDEIMGWVEWWESEESEGKRPGWVVTQLRAGVRAPVAVDRGLGLRGGPILIHK